MCGIWFYLSKNCSYNNNIELYTSFMNIKHRGPNSSNFVILNKYNLQIGFHRLAINGLINTTANQPFIFNTREKSIYVICNGEIYNYKELAVKYNIELFTGSDCEILHPLYDILGADMVNELDGEFAFIMCEIDKITDEINVFVSRDQCGIRPLFVSSSDNFIMFASELKGLIGENCYHYPPRHYTKFSSNDNFTEIAFNKYYDVENIPQTITNFEHATKMIRYELINSVKSRLMSDVPIGCLLSGGLDSSLSASIMAFLCPNQKIKTFCIGMDENATDVSYAKLVAEHIKSDHKTIIIPKQEWLEALEYVICVIESFDITTVRASTAQYLISKWIAANENIKVLLVGDGSDELTNGYRYCSNAPDNQSFNDETCRLLNEIHEYDVLRTDRGISHNGLEARVPFLRKEFITKYLSIDVNLRRSEGKIEKYLLREAFAGTNLLPDEVLYRKKEALSDGVSSLTDSWYIIIQKHIDTLITDDEFEMLKNNYIHCQPISKESLYYRQIFEKYFGKCCSNIIKHYWLPKWCGEVNDPSARELKIY